MTGVLRSFIARYKAQIALAIVLCLGLALRCYHLGFQSLWIDEINSAIESDPSLRDHGLLYYLRHVDQQPPLFFFAERFAIWAFGNNEAALRLVPALAGTGGIWAIYGLGKELRGPRLGLCAAAILAVNPFSIYYSQDARPYTLVLLLSILSWTALLRFTKSINLRGCLMYAGVTLLMLYTNYFGIYVVAAQVILLAIVLISEPELNRRLLWFIVLAGGIIAIGFAPLLPILRDIAHINKFWAARPGEDVAIDYFYEYFGHSDLLKPLLLLLLISFLVHLFLNARNTDGRLSAKSLSFLFVLCGAWIFCGFFFSFVRSYLVVPMMVSRYTITVLPAFVLLLASGLAEIDSAAVRRVVLGIFVLLSLTHIVVVKDYYRQTTKTEFRELGNYMSADTGLMLPVIAGHSGWHQRYYLGKHGYQGAVPEGEDLKHKLDSLLQSGYRGGFWLSGAHMEGMPDASFYKPPDSAYIMLKQVQLYDCWAQVFVPKTFYGTDTRLITARDLPEAARYNDRGDLLIPVWKEPVTLPAIRLAAGTYQCRIAGRGSRAFGVYPHMRVYVNGREIGSSNMGEHEVLKSFSFRKARDTVAAFSLALDNDAYDADKGEDRNLFIRALLITRVAQ